MFLLGLKVSNPEWLACAAFFGQSAVVRCLAKELGADVEEAMGHVCAPLAAEAYSGRLDVVRCLGEELWADDSMPFEDESRSATYFAQRR